MKTTRLISMAFISGFLSLVSAPTVQADTSNRVRPNFKVTLNIGDSAIVHATRGRCGQLPSKSTLVKVKKKLDRKLTTGHIEFGKPGVRLSNKCEGLTPVYETLFVADRLGKETIMIHGNLVYISVK